MSLLVLMLVYKGAYSESRQETISVEVVIIGSNSCRRVFPNKDKSVRNNLFRRVHARLFEFVRFLKSKVKVRKATVKYINHRKSKGSSLYNSTEVVHMQNRNLHEYLEGGLTQTNFRTYNPEHYKLILRRLIVSFPGIPKEGFVLKM